MATIGLISLSILVFSAGAVICLTPDQKVLQIVQGSDIESMNRAQLAAYERLSALAETTKEPNPKLDNDAVLKFQKDNVSPAVIVQMIRSSRSSYDVSPKGVDLLRREKLDPAILQAMTDKATQDSEDDIHGRKALEIRARDRGLPPSVANK